MLVYFAFTFNLIYS